MVMNCVKKRVNLKEKHPDFNESRCFLVVEAMGVEPMSEKSSA